MSTQSELQATVEALVQAGKGILAADESVPTIAKRFKAIGVESTEENRRAYRSLLLGTPGLGEFISGVILHEETLGQCTDAGTALPQWAAQQGIVPGISDADLVNRLRRCSDIEVRRLISCRRY